MKLTDREWKEFFIGGKEGIFDLCASFSGIDKNKLLDGDVSNNLFTMCYNYQKNLITL